MTLIKIMDINDIILSNDRLIISGSINFNCKNLNSLKFLSIFTIECHFIQLIKYIQLPHNNSYLIISAFHDKSFFKIWNIPTRKCISKLISHFDQIILVIYLLEGISINYQIFKR